MRRSLDVVHMFVNKNQGNAKPDQGETSETLETNIVQLNLMAQKISRWFDMNQKENIVLHQIIFSQMSRD